MQDYRVRDGGRCINKNIYGVLVRQRSVAVSSPRFRLLRPYPLRATVRNLFEVSQSLQLSNKIRGGARTQREREKAEKRSEEDTAAVSGRYCEALEELVYNRWSPRSTVG